MITKLGKIARDSKGQLRDYSKEYSTYHSKKDQIKNRVLRNMARRKSGLKVGDPREVDHKIPLSKGGSGSLRNTRVVSRSVNRRKFVKVANPILAALAHIGQNAFIDKQLDNPRFHKYLLNRALSNIHDNPFVTKLQALKNGVIGGLVPEVSILGDESAHLGAKLKPLLIDTVDGVPKVNKRSLVLLKSLLKGDFKNLSTMASYGKNRAKLGEFLEVMNIPNRKQILMAMKYGNTEAMAPVLNDMEKAWAKNRVTGKLARGIGDILGKKSIANGSALAGRIEKGGRIVGLGGLTAADPITGGVNVVKHIYGDKSKWTKSLSRVRSLVTKKMLVNPTKKNFMRGVNGGPTVNKGIQAADKFGGNAVVHSVKHLANDFGLIFKKYKM